MTPPSRPPFQRPPPRPSDWEPVPIPQPVDAIHTSDPETPTLRELAERERQRASLAAAPALAWLELAYTHADDDSPMAGAPYRVRFADGSTREGRLDGQGHARLDGLPAALAGTAVDVRFGEPSAAFRPLPVAAEANPDYRPHVLAALTTPGGPTYAAEGDGASRLMFASYQPGAPGAAAEDGARRGVARAVEAAPDGPVHEVLEYLWSLVAGAYKQDPTSGEIVGQMVVAMIPVVGQIADVRDLSAYIYQLSTPNLAAEARRAAWIGLVLTGVALLLPEVGAAVAGVGRLALKGGSEAERLALPLLRRVGRGDALRFLERELSAARIEARAEAALARVSGYLRGFFAAVERTWLPVGEAVRRAAGQALADLARVAAEGRTAIRQVAAEVAAKVKPLLSKIEQEGERAAGSTNSRVEQKAGAEAAGRPPEPEGPGEPARAGWHGRYPRTAEEYEALARDPAHGGNITKGAEQERHVGLALEERGDVPGPITRDPNPERGDFVDARGRVWDVKGFNSNFPARKGGFRLDRDAAAVDKSLAKEEDVMLDTTNLTPEHIDQLRAEGVSRGWGNRVLWWP